MPQNSRGKGEGRPPSSEHVCFSPLARSENGCSDLQPRDSPGQGKPKRRQHRRGRAPHAATRSHTQPRQARVAHAAPPRPTAGPQGLRGAAHTAGRTPLLLNVPSVHRAQSGAVWPGAPPDSSPIVPPRFPAAAPGPAGGGRRHSSSCSSCSGFRDEHRGRPRPVPCVGARAPSRGRAGWSEPQSGDPPPGPPSRPALGRSCARSMEGMRQLPGCIPRWPRHPHPWAGPGGPAKGGGSFPRCPSSAPSGRPHLGLATPAAGPPASCAPTGGAFLLQPGEGFRGSSEEGLPSPQPRMFLGGFTIIF